MASWQDKLPVFNPYTPQLPVDAMVSVGREKQQRYDEGVQKIQTSIDNVAGLDIIRDVDKSYLQSKLNQLGDNLKVVAAGDFSNFQLVNSVSGMTSRIAKDTNIQNAVYSTRRYRKGTEDMESFNKEGKGSPSNDWDFKTQANNWMNNGDVKATFNGSYNPYTDYKKNALELIKALTKDETITDDAFTIDKKGNLVIIDALVRKKFAGLSPEKIQQTLLSGLSPADYKQMGIDGRYNYSNMDAPSFISTVNNSYKEKLEPYSEKRNILNNSLDSTKSVAERSIIESQIASIDKEMKSISEEYKGISGTFANGDVESAKARLHTVNFLKGFSKAFSYTQISQTIEANPYADMAMRREVKNQDRELSLMRMMQEERHFNLTREDKIKAAELKAKGSSGVYGALIGGEEDKNVPTVTALDVAQKIGNWRKNISDSDVTFMKQNGKDDAWLDQQYQAWKEGKSVKSYIADHFRDRDDIRRQIKSYDIMTKQIEAEAAAQLDEQGRPLGDIYNKIPSGAPTIHYNSPIGPVSISPREIVDFNEKLPQLMSTQSSIGSPLVPNTTTTFLDDKAKSTLSPKELILYNIFKRNYYGDKNLTPVEKSIDATRVDYYTYVNMPQQVAITKMRDYTNTEITKRVTGSQGANYNMPMDSDALKTEFGQMLSSVANEVEKVGGWENSPSLNSGGLKLLRQVAANPKGGTIKVVEGTDFAPKMYEISALDKDGKAVSFKLTPEQKQKMLGSRFDPEPSVQALRPYQEQMRMASKFGNTTAYDGGATTAKNAYLTHEDFPMVGSEGYGVSGNIITTSSGYSIRLNIYDPTSGKWYEDIDYPSQSMLEREVVPFMAGLTDARIFEIIHGKPATANDLKQVKESSKNPNNGR